MNSRIDIAQYCTEFVIEAILNYIVYNIQLPIS